MGNLELEDASSRGNTSTATTIMKAKDEQVRHGLRSRSRDRANPSSVVELVPESLARENIVKLPLPKRRDDQGVIMATPNASSRRRQTRFVLNRDRTWPSRPGKTVLEAIKNYRRAGVRRRGDRVGHSDAPGIHRQPRLTSHDDGGGRQGGWAQHDGRRRRAVIDWCYHIPEAVMSGPPTLHL